MDGVAGVTQDAVPVGGTFTYRFVANQVGTYWYHSHQVSDKQVTGGLFGALVIKPRARLPQSVDVLATAHIYGGQKTLNGKPEDLRMAAKPGEQVRVRVINTDNGPVETWAGVAVPGAGHRRVRRARADRRDRQGRHADRRRTS